MREAQPGSAEVEAWFVANPHALVDGARSVRTWIQALPVFG